MLDVYRTVRDYGEAEIVIRKSRFIGHARPVADEEEAIRFIEEIKKRHGNATHNCSACIVGERDQWQKQSDDGEPSGTAGRPILDVIKMKRLKNVCVVVTRYFGGIMLGAGGLIRAYTDGAAAGLDAAGLVYRVLYREVEVELDYTWHGKVENALRERGVRTADTRFTDKVALTCMPVAAEAERFVAWMTDLTQGQARVCLGAETYVAQDEPPDGLG